MWQIDSGSVRGEGDGLLNHVVNLRTFAFDRHASTVRELPTPRPPGMGYLDFPRHAGFYIGVWAFLHSKTGEDKYLEWSTKLLEHHWRSRHPKSGLLPVCTVGARARRASSESMLSLAISLLEAARVLPDGEASSRFESAGKALFETVVALPHRPSDGEFLTDSPVEVLPRDVKRDTNFSRPYEFRYGGGFSADSALLLLAGHRLTGNARSLELATEFGEFYRSHNPPPPTEIVRAHVYASIIGLFLDLHALKGRQEDLQQAERYGNLAIGRLFHNGLFRAATGVDHYEGEMMVGNLVYNLAWLHTLKSRASFRMKPIYFNR